MFGGFVDLVENDLRVVENEGMIPKALLCKDDFLTLLTLGCVGCSLHVDKSLCKRCILG